MASLVTTIEALWATLTLWLNPMAPVATVVALPVAVVAVTLAGLPLWQQRRTRLLLAKKFGAEFYNQATITNVTRYYVRQQCTNIDPTQEAELRHSFPVQEPLFKAIDRFLGDTADYHHGILLADSGMGKTSFVLNYYAYNQRRAARKRHRLAVVPLGSRHAMDHIHDIPQPQETVLFLDAFDEDAHAIADHRQRLFDLMTACELFKRVLITCRTQFFLRDEEIPQEPGLIRVAPPEAGGSKGYTFWKFYLAPFDDGEVSTFLRRRYPWQWRTRRRARQLVETIPLLSIRPMLLAYIPDLLETRRPITTAYELYTVMVEKWIAREQPLVQPDALRMFSERLAVDLYRTWRAGESDRRHYTALEPLALGWDIPLKDWQLRGRSLLNRDAEGNYKFAHRSIMEYLVVTRALQGDDACRGLPLTDQMYEFLRGADLRGAQLVGMDLRNTNLADLDLTGADLTGANLTGADLTSVNLAGVDLRSTRGLTSGQLITAVTDEHTQLPKDCIAFVLIPAGTFLMGSTDGASDERPVHQVTISQPFYLGQYQVTQAQWEAVMGNNPSYFPGDPNRPVENVSWEGVQAFFRKLNANEGSTAYRLPTEAEWEYAVRAGTTSAYSFGDDSRQLGEYAWYSANSGNTTHPVGQQKPNAWGLYDMHGNVWEWVEDRWHSNYTDAPKDGTAWTAGTSSSWVVRGGSFGLPPVYLRSAHRDAVQPEFRRRRDGFRCVRVSPQP